MPCSVDRGALPDIKLIYPCTCTFQSAHRANTHTHICTLAHTVLSRASGGPRAHHHTAAHAALPSCTLFTHTHTHTYTHAHKHTVRSRASGGPGARHPSAAHEALPRPALCSSSRRKGRGGKQCRGCVRPRVWHRQWHEQRAAVVRGEQ